MENIKIAITDDDALIVSLLQAYLHSVEGFEVLFTANEGSALLEQLEAVPVLPDVLILDLKMEGMDGLQVAEHMKAKYPSVSVIVVSSHYQRSFMGFMLKMGVAAFLPKGISPIDLVEIIRTVHSQGYYFQPDQVNALRDQISSKSPKPSLEQEDSLSDRETEVLRLICQQKTAKEIADALFTTQRTIEGHKSSLFAKTGAKNIAGLVIFAIQHGVIRVEELPLI
ncbi:response regulator transcription factor [Flavobacterium sp. MFBS3-15]|uniref:response regulator transcription factor n=1 Tax=Flavobacterium sp. MFBS3-15 TaxID=2989816 RepID=UPI002236969A|nr:response regulator transcription factor [Flavobacterium sp. MFBS3-15]MCW4469041.1 response regulator transcription factor [Flavobacterium sp. MFBS3-15]